MACFIAYRMITDVSFLPRMSTGDDIVFEFQTIVKPNQRTKKPNFTGPFTRGTPSKRFFYINIGQSAGQKDTPWQRRAKVC